MRKVMFQFNQEIAGDLFQALSPFRYLQELHNWGGDFYTDKLKELLELVGKQLKVLYLIHVDQIDLQAVSQISNICVGLTTLGLYNCHIGEMNGSTPPDSLSEYNNEVI